MNILVIGLGSMGKRRIRLLHEIYPEFHVFGIDSRKDRREKANNLFKIECFSSIQEVEVNIDCAFVCTSPLSHSSNISECLKRKWNVFSEINLIDDGYDYNIGLAKENNCTLFLSSTFFYREEVRYIRSKAALNEKWNYIYHIGQYLPDWHPWENYTDYFVGEKSTNGCREILAIELPWIMETFGDITKTHVISDKMTALNIPYNDNFMIQMIHENGNKGILVVDVISPFAVRKFEMYTEGQYVCWNGTPDSLFEFAPEKGKLNRVLLNEEAEYASGYKDFIVENAYKNEIHEFFEVVLNGKNSLYGFKQDKKVLQIIDSLGA